MHISSTWLSLPPQAPRCKVGFILCFGFIPGIWYKVCTWFQSSLVSTSYHLLRAKLHWNILFGLLMQLPESVVSQRIELQDSRVTNFNLKQFWLFMSICRDSIIIKYAVMSNYTANMSDTVLLKACYSPFSRVNRPWRVLNNVIAVWHPCTPLPVLISVITIHNLRHDIKITSLHSLLVLSE